MIYVGIDVASTKHDCFITNEQGEVYSNSFTIENNYDGFSQLRQAIKDFSKQTNDSNVSVGLESTGHYSQNILMHLIKFDYSVYYINPLFIDGFKKAKTIRKTKTDKLDCQLIASYLQQNIDTLEPYKSTDVIYDELKILTRHRAFLVAERAKVKVNLKRLITIVFPEYINIFSSLCNETSLAILYRFPLPSQISKLEAKDINEYVKRKFPHCRIDYTKFEQIIELAKKTIGSKLSSYSIEIKSLINMINYFCDEIDKIENQIDKYVSEVDSDIFNIPGVSNISGASLLGEIGSISKFKHADQLVAFAGYDPTIYESGKYSSSSGKMAKRGSKYLRTMIWHIALVLTNFDEKYHLYYLKKKAEGLHHNKILGHIGKKFLRLLYSILKNNTKYQKSYQIPLTTI